MFNSLMHSKQIEEEKRCINDLTNKIQRAIAHDDLTKARSYAESIVHSIDALSDVRVREKEEKLLHALSIQLHPSHIERIRSRLND